MPRNDNVLRVTVGVVIPCRNEAHWIGEVLEALAAQDRRPDDVVVVDDGSTDGTADAIRNWPDAATGQDDEQDRRLKIRVIAGPARGVAAAVNAGVSALNTDVIVRLDGHCRPEPDYVGRTAALAIQQEVGVAGGAWTIKPSAPTLEAEAIAIAVQHGLGSGGAAYRRQSVAEVETERPRLHAPSAVDTVPFGCFRRALWQELGGLDERLWSNEDYDFNFRVRARGLRVMLDPTIRCTYYARPHLRSLARQYGRYGWWKARMLLLHPRSIRWRQLIPAMLVPALLVAALGTMIRPEPIWPLALACYPVVVVAGAVHAALSHRRAAAAMMIAAAFFTIHIFWSAGFWASLLSVAAGGAAGHDEAAISPQGGARRDGRRRSRE